MILVWTLRILTFILGIIPLILAIPCGILFVITEELEVYFYLNDMKKNEKEMLDNIREKSKNL